MVVIRRTHDLKEAEALWRAISPCLTIFDDWDYRYAFFRYEPYPLDFYGAYEVNNDKEELIGLMPLQVNSEHGREFFSEPDCEENHPFIKGGCEYIIPDLYKAIEAPAKCFDISGADSFTTSLPLEDYIYVLPLEGLGDFSDFLTKRLSPKKKRNLRQEMRDVEKYNPEIIWNNPADIGALFSLNIKKFGEESYLDSKGERGWRELLNLPFDYQLAVIKIDGKIAAASFSIYYKGTYYYLINGANLEYSNLGKYLNKINLERAINLGAKFLDAGLGDCNWKEAWHFDRIAQYKFIK